MRLNLRTLLAYQDDPKLPEAASLTQQLSENAEARQLLTRLQNLAVQPRMASPSLQTTGTLDANYVAQYVDNCLPPEQYPIFERACLKSDSALAEVAAIHQIACRMSEQPAAIAPRLRDRIYQVPNQDSVQPAILPPADTTSVDAAEREQDWDSATDVESETIRETGRQKLAQAAHALEGLKNNIVALGRMPETPTVASPSTNTEDSTSSPRHWWILVAIVLIWFSVWFTFPRASAWYQKITTAFRSAPPEQAPTSESLSDDIAQAPFPVAKTAPSDSVKRLFSEKETVAPAPQHPLDVADRVTNASPGLPPLLNVLPVAPSPNETPTGSPPPTPLPEPLSDGTSSPPLEAPQVPLLSEPMVATPELPPLLNEDDTTEETEPEPSIAESILPAPMPTFPASVGTEPESTQLAEGMPAPDSSVNPESTPTATPKSNLPPLPSPDALTQAAETTAELETPISEPADSSVVVAEATTEPSVEASGMETQLAAAVRDLPPIDLPKPEQPSTPSPSPLLPMPLAPATMPTGDNRVANKQPEEQAPLGTEASNPLTNPRTPLDGNEILELQQQIAMVSLDPKWSIVLPGGIGKLQARGRTSIWNLTFSGISKLTASVENSEPAIEVRRCFALVQSTVPNETLRILTPKGPVFLTALQPNSELVIEVRPYLPPGFSADTTPTRYVLGCLGVQGTFVVGHNQTEKAISQDDWMMVDMDGQANHFHQPLPANIVQSIEYLKNGTPMASVAALNQVLSQSNGPARLNEMACRSMTPGSEDSIAQRSLAGIWSYYLGQMEPIASILNDPAMKNEWPDHMESVRDCLLSEPKAREQLQNVMEELWQDETLADRLVGYNPNEIKATIIQGLVSDLESPTLARRLLAIQSLKQLWQKDFGYDPLAEGPAFDASVQQWRQLLQDSLTSRIGVNPSPGLVPAAGR